ncbi:HTH-type transcriptional activator IlvY [Desulfoprunum benzoelyticum]|uniref:LysR family positive regulator for ilvC n=1 Tax=Desulfoprunum benzoelyticum TaxID=1506996 RepID=A0A840V0X3_9BACT|nr:HTH-type transcriptional activator IlvY [Desulfoprunum benzoelyticum]MBB5347460.1 LysR family positive regulator for ilvC [Desulfoprunum benzoelyticum]MBM9529661.1 HTH-type transcriptional activator IlvY [Desulfoprunum benzoelyticum]
MDIHELKIFRHLARSLHFGRTSQACNITPSGLTRTVQRLENELGRQLLLRDRRSVSLTPAGMIFREYAEEAIQHWSKLQASLAGNNTLAGEISLYCSVTAILSILPDIFSRFRKAHPEVLIHLQTGDAAMAIGKLQNGEADIAIAALPDHLPESLEFIEIIRTPLIFIRPSHFPDSVVYDHGSIDWQQTPLIVAERGLSRQRADRWFSEKGIQPNIYSQVAGNEAIIAMVGMGCGVGIVPRLVLDKSPQQDQVAILAVTPELEPFRVGACTLARSRRNPVVQSFWRIIEAEVAARKATATTS